MQCPKLRSIDAFPVEISGEEYICLQDPHRYVESPILVAPATFFILQFFDGRHTVEDVQRAFRRRFGEELEEEQIEQIALQLDEARLLDSPAFSEYARAVRDEFSRTPLRPAAHQGTAYADTPDALLRQLDGYFTHQKGPGALPDATRGPLERIRAVMAPHIDFEAGGPTFAWSYDALAASDADLFVILGTSHVGMQNFLALTRKHFETPLGIMETDERFVDELAGALPYDGFADELLHRAEHSIEFQVAWLQHLFRERPISIVPMLCGGSMAEAIHQQHPLAEVDQIDESVTALRQTLARHPNACVIASVDFSHVGVRYGHQAPPAPETLQQVETLDRKLLDALAAASPAEFAAHVYDTGNVTQVCGIAPLYAMLATLDGARGRLLHYDCVELSPGSHVSFAGMVWK